MTSPSTNHRVRSAVAAAVVLAMFTACAPNGELRGSVAVPDDTVPELVDVAAPAEPVLVTIERSRFGVPELRVEPGTTVVWRNDDAFAHTVTAADASPIAFDSTELREGGTFEMTFDEPGEYPYFCQIHPTMRAVVIVG